MRLDRFEALVKGYLSTATFLKESEKANLAWKVFQEKDDDGKLIADPSDPENGPHPAVDGV